MSMTKQLVPVELTIIAGNPKRYRATYRTDILDGEELIASVGPEYISFTDTQSARDASYRVASTRQSEDERKRDTSDRKTGAQILADFGL